jgi:hypothetical protein
VIERRTAHDRHQADAKPAAEEVRPRPAIGPAAVLALQRSAGNAAVATLFRKQFSNAAVQWKAGEIAAGGSRGGLGDYIEAKVRLRAEEIHTDTGSNDNDRNYFQAKTEVERAWTEFEKLKGNADAASLDWDLMENGLSTDEFGHAVNLCRERFVTTLAGTRDLAGTLAHLRQQHAKVKPLLEAIDQAETATKAHKSSKEVFNVAAAAATAKLLEPVKTMTTLAELTKFCEHVAGIHGISPLNAIEDYVNNAALKLPLQTATAPAERSKAVQDVAKAFDRALGADIAPQSIDPGGRLLPDKKPNVGPDARHAETIHIEGDRNRQLVLGVGRPGDPQGYQDFAKDYGMWDYESWGAWNKQSQQFSAVAQQINPDNGADVDTVLGGKDASGKQIFDKLHFRLTGVFPTIPSVKEKLLAALALYSEKFNARANNYHGHAINPLWTLGEIVTIVSSDELAKKTSFYGDRNDEYVNRLTDILPADPVNILPLFQPKIPEYTKIGDDVAAKIKASYKGRQQSAALKRVADTYYNIPRGYDYLINDVDKHVAGIAP